MPYPYVARAGEVSRLCVPGVPLGLMEEASFDEVPFHIEPGDTLLLTTDGTTDAVDAEGRIYDPQRFVDSVRRGAPPDLPGFLKQLFAGIADFAGGTELADDVTMLALRRHDR
jgi:sigma-B regulation protein RsbU (phosphoserine phosphatase)